MLAASTAALALHAAAAGRTLGVRFVPVRSHWVQALMHASLFAGWAPFFPGVVEHLPHFAAQLLFYYGFELVLAWSRRDLARTGFGALPILGSTNLFLWFRDDWFVLQFAMLATGALAKEFLLWERDGRRTHVFNPSSFPLFLACAALWAGSGDGLTWASEIAVSQEQVPHGLLGIFLLGLVVQSLFAVTLVTLGAVVALFAANQVFTALTGVYVWTDVGIPVAVYLGCHFLITDPATSPRTARGRLLFGLLYGLAVCGLYIVLRLADGPAHYDKLLCVPFLNLLVRRLDGLGGTPPSAMANRIHVALAVILFASFHGTRFFGDDHPGDDIALWERACARSVWVACESPASLVDQACHASDWPSCERYAVLSIEGRGVERDLADALYHRTLACQQGVADACEGVEALRRDGGDAALEEACEGGAGLSCMVLGTLLHGSMDGPADPAASRHWLRRSCELGVAEACEFLGSDRAGPTPER